MKIIGALRVQNEARWISRVLASIAPICAEFHVFDDNSTDDTAKIAHECGANVYRSPYVSLNEVRDKQWLLEKIRGRGDWILWIDGDELLDQRSIPKVLLAAESNAQCISFRIRYLWNDENTERVDPPVYSNFRRQSMFRPGMARFVGEGKGPNFHCGNVPRSLWGACAYPDVSLLHLGYMDKADRVRKYHWYNEVDPNNEAEDRYRHIVIGDLWPAESKFKHGGPLKLERL